MNYCEEALIQFIHYIKSQTHIEFDGDICIYTLPFKDPFSDNIEVAISNPKDRLFKISDMKQCISFLFHSGINIERDNRYMKRFYSIISEYGFEFKEGEISKVIDAGEIGSSFLEAIQLIFELYGIGIMPEIPIDEISFQNIVSKYLEDNQYDFSRNEKIKGKTYEHTINFVLRNGKSCSLVEVLSAKSSSDATQKAKLVAFKFFDITELGNGYKKVALVDDYSPVFKKKAFDILHEYSDSVITWSDRDVLLSVHGR